MNKLKLIRFLLVFMTFTAYTAIQAPIYADDWGDDWGGGDDYDSSDYNSYGWESDYGGTAGDSLFDDNGYHADDDNDDVPSGFTATGTTTVRYYDFQYNIYQAAGSCYGNCKNSDHVIGDTYYGEHYIQVPTYDYTGDYNTGSSSNSNDNDTSVGGNYDDDDDDGGGGGGTVSRIAEDNNTQDQEEIHTSGSKKIDQAVETLNKSTNPFIKNLVEKTKKYSIQKLSKVTNGNDKKELQGFTQPHVVNPRLGGLIKISTDKATSKSFLEVLNTIIHEKGHAYLAIIQTTPDSQLKAEEIVIKNRLLEIKNAVRNVDGTTNITGFEGIRFTMVEFLALKFQGHHIAIIEFFVEETAKALKDILISNPEVYGTIDDKFKNDIRAFQILAIKSEFSKGRTVPNTSLSPFIGIKTYYNNNYRTIRDQLKK